MKVSAYMRSHVFALRPEDTVEQAAHAFDLYQQPVLPIVDKDQMFLGAVWPDRLADWLEAQRRVSSQSQVAATGLSVVMDVQAPTCAPDDLVKAGADLMRNARRPAVIVVDEGRVAGFLGWPEVAVALIEEPTEF